MPHTVFIIKESKLILSNSNKTQMQKNEMGVVPKWKVKADMLGDDCHIN